MNNLISQRARTRTNSMSPAIARLMADEPSKAKEPVQATKDTVSLGSGPSREMNQMNCLRDFARGRASQGRVGVQTPKSTPQDMRRETSLALSGCVESANPELHQKIQDLMSN